MDLIHLAENLKYWHSMDAERKLQNKYSISLFRTRQLQVDVGTCSVSDSPSQGPASRSNNLLLQNSQGWKPSFDRRSC
jgi:hypothetical protein